MSFKLIKSKGYKGVYILDGGLNTWKEKVLFPKAPVNATKDALVQFEKMKEVSRFLGGQPQTDSAIAESNRVLNCQHPILEHPNRV